MSEKNYWQNLDKPISAYRVKEFYYPKKLPVREAIEKFVLKNKIESVLDAGCNTGMFGFRLFDKGYDGTYLGIDSNPTGIKYAIRMRLADPKKCKFKLCDIEDTSPLKKRSFELVYTKDVIEHLESYKKAISELSKLTTKYLAVSFFIPLKDEESIHRHNDRYYLNHYCRKEFYEYVKSLKFGKPKIIYGNGDNEIIVFKKL